MGGLAATTREVTDIDPTIGFPVRLLSEELLTYFYPWLDLLDGSGKGINLSTFC